MQSTLRFKVSEFFTRYNFSKEDAHFITDVLNEIDEHQVKKYEENKDLFLTQRDKADLVERINAVEIKISEAKAEIIKWSFIFWIGTILCILGGLFAILKIFFEK